MSGSIAKAYVQVIPSAQGMKGNLSNVFNSEMPSAGQSAGGIYSSSMIGKIKSLIVSAGLGKLLGECLTSGADLQQSLGGIETLFKDSAGTVIANAEMAYKTAGMSANEYMENVTSFSASLLQSLGGDTEKAAIVADMALRDMSDNANKLGSDMESIQNAYQGFAKQNYTMLDNLKLGYGGTKSEMERLLADAQKLTGVKYDINNLSDVYTAIHVIQEEMDITGTTALESAATISGSFSSMKAAFSDLLANLALGRDIEGPLSALTESVITFAGNLLPAVGSILQGLPAVLSAALNAAIQGLNLAANNAGSIVQMGIELVKGIGSAVITALPYLAEAAVNIVAALGNAIISTDWLQIGQDAINGIKSSLDLAAFEILGTDGNIVQSVCDSILMALPDLLDSGVTIVSEIANGLLAGLPGFIECAGQLLTSLVSYAMDAAPLLLSSGMELVLNLANGLIANLPTVVSSAATIIADLLSTIAGKLPELLQQGISLVGELAAGLIQAIPDLLEAGAQLIGDVLDVFAETDWLQLGKDIINGIIAGISEAAGLLWDALVDLANSALEKAKEALGIQSPSRRFRQEIGRWLPPGIAEGVYDNTSIVDDAMRDLSDHTASSFKTHLRMDIGDAETSRRIPYELSSGKSVQVVQNIYSTAQTAADLMEEALYLQERAVLIGV